MDDRIISDTVHWLQSNVAARTSKQEIADKMQGADLPEEGRETLRDLPDGEYSKEEVVQWVQQNMLSRIGAAHQAMRGFGGSM